MGGTYNIMCVCVCVCVVGGLLFRLPRLATGRVAALMQMDLCMSVNDTLQGPSAWPTVPARCNPPDELKIDENISDQVLVTQQHTLWRTPHIPTV